MLKALQNIELTWVNTPQKLQEVAVELGNQDILAVDTESNSLYAYQEQVCLIQFSTREKDFLIDTLLLSDLSPLASLFKNPSILKVFHAAEYDLICLFRDFGFRFNYIFDTMIAARILGYQKVGLGDLLTRHFQIRVDKKYQRANWGKRPLKPEMLEYARLDSRYLIPIQDYLRGELRKSGRWDIALEDFNRLTEGIVDTTENHTDDFWKLRGARDLDPRQAAVLKSLYQFRENRAKSQNRPTFKIISQQALLEMAQQCPTSREELLKLPALSNQLVNRYGTQLLKAVRQGQSAPGEYPPQCPRLEEPIIKRIDALRAWRKYTGQQMGVPSDVILPRDVLNRIAMVNPADIESLKSQMHDVPCRFERFKHEIFRILQKGG